MKWKEARQKTLMLSQGEAAEEHLSDKFWSYMQYR